MFDLRAKKVSEFWHILRDLKDLDIYRGNKFESEKEMHNLLHIIPRDSGIFCKRCLGRESQILRKNIAFNDSIKLC